MEAMLTKIKDRALADIDWDAPGAETIRPEFRPKLKAFMADLCWTEDGFATQYLRQMSDVRYHDYRAVARHAQTYAVSSA